MKIVYNDLINFFSKKPTKELLSKKLFQLGHEHDIDGDIYDLDLTPNRGDCLSLLGLARDLNIFFELVEPYKLFKEEIEDYIHVTIGDSKEVLKTSEIALITSGTATLESALSYTPCVTLYKTNSLSYLIIKPLLMIKNFSLPNLILEEEFLPELLQSKVTDENILNAVHEITDKGIGQYINKFAQIKRTLQAGGPAKAAEEVIKLIKK